MAIIKSTTARKHGWGSMPHRSVSHLTSAERQAVRNGDIVYFRFTPWNPMQSGIKIVTVSPYGFDCREPSISERQIIETQEKK
jgi:hypothetical protein